MDAAAFSQDEVRITNCVWRKAAFIGFASVIINTHTKKKNPSVWMVFQFDD